MGNLCAGETTSNCLCCGRILDAVGDFSAVCRSHTSLKQPDGVGQGLSQTSASAGFTVSFEAGALPCVLSQALGAVMLFPSVLETQHHQWSLFLCSLCFS